MIVYASPRAQGVDVEGNTQPIAVVGAPLNELRIADLESRDYLQEVIKEIKIMNMHLSIMSDLIIDRKDII